MIPSAETILEQLKLQRSILRDGGYGSSVRTPRRAEVLLRDSITCLNFGESEKRHPCHECFLWGWVPRPHREEVTPCHFIPLNDSGETIQSLEVRGDRGEAERALLTWLDRAITQMEEKVKELSAGRRDGQRREGASSHPALIGLSLREPFHGLFRTLELAGSLPIHYATDLKACLELLERQPAVVLLQFPDDPSAVNEAWRWLEVLAKKTLVVIVSDREETGPYVQAMWRGAFDYLTPSAPLIEVKRIVDGALGWRPSRLA